MPRLGCLVYPVHHLKTLIFPAEAHSCCMWKARKLLNRLRGFQLRFARFLLCNQEVEGSIPFSSTLYLLFIQRLKNLTVQRAPSVCY